MKEKKKPREFTVWIKWDAELPGKMIHVAQKPHRDVLISYEEIDVIEVAPGFDNYDKAIKLLEKLCAPEPDGFGSFVADEFMPPEVLEGRKFLASLKEEEE
jgi:hypothetical protein